MATTMHLSANRVATVSTRTPRHRCRGAETIVSISAKRKSPLVLTAEDCLRLARETADPSRLEDLADSIKRTSYFGAVRATADSILADLTNSTIDTAGDLETRIHEDCDGARCVIYTAAAMDVLRYSDNDNAYADDFGDEGLVRDGSINWSGMAYAAFRADIVEQLQAHGVDLSEPFTCDSCGDTFATSAELTSGRCDACQTINDDSLSDEELRS
jgi:hypothetical protein